MTKTIRIGSGAGYAGDRLEPSLELIEKGNLDYISYECLAERTIAIGQQAKLKDPSKGYNGLLEHRMEKALPLCWKHKVKLITNMGSANPQAAAQKCVEIARRHGLTGMKIACVTGDDLLPVINKYMDAEVWETHEPLSKLPGEIVSANAYMEQVTSFSASLISSLSGDTAKAATVADMAMIDMADNANKFGTDMESIQNAYQGFAKQNYTMLDNLKLGYGGTKEEMQRLLSDAQKLTGTKYDIDNLADVYNAIHAIQENLGVTGTTAKEASETFSGSFSAMKAAAQNLLGNMAIGGDVTGSMKELVSTASTFLLDNAIPMVGRVITSLPEAIQTGLQTAAPKIKSLGAGIVKSLRDGIVSFLPAGMGGIVDDLFSAIGDFKSGFAAMQPQLASFGASVKATLQQASVAVMPAITSIIQTVQTVIPTVLPVIQTVVGTIGQVISAAAPVIAGLVQGIGTVISTLAPVFQVIFDGIGQKVGSVLSFIGSKMGWIQEIIGTVMPVVADILTSAWSVISPIIDIAISVFKVLFNVVQTVFNGIASVISSVWDKVKPIVEGIGNGLSWIADKVGGLFGFGGGGGGDTGSNAEGTNNWRGGPTWVGEQGPELIDLPRGTRILPNKESVQLASSLQKMRAATAAQNTTPVPANAPIRQGGSSTPAASVIQLTLAKLADTIVVREEADIDKIGEKVAKEVVLAVKNMVPVPA